MSESNPFILNLGSFLPQTSGYSREFPFDYPEIEFEDNFFLEELQGVVTATRTQQGIVLQGEFDAKLTLDCVRCLKEYSHLLQWDLTEFYVFRNHELNGEDDLIFPENARIDLTDTVAEEAQINIPFNPICKENCQGLCQVCGTDLNLKDCGHEDPPAEEKSDSDENSPFAGLKDLLSD